MPIQCNKQQGAHNNQELTDNRNRNTIWIKELSNQLNASASYERAAKDWEGDFVFVIEADSELSETAYLYMDLYHGKSPSAAQLSGPDEKDVAVLGLNFQAAENIHSQRDLALRINVDEK